MKVYNKRDKNVPRDAIYVGRPTIFGNPYTIRVHGTRDEVIKKYEEYVTTFPKRYAQTKEYLKDKDLVCWCAPLPCHADVLMRIAK